MCEIYQTYKAYKNITKYVYSLRSNPGPTEVQPCGLLTQDHIPLSLRLPSYPEVTPTLNQKFIISMDDCLFLLHMYIQLQTTWQINGLVETLCKWHLLLHYFMKLKMVFSCLTDRSSSNINSRGQISLIMQFFYHQYVGSKIAVLV